MYQKSQPLQCFSMSFKKIITKENISLLQEKQAKIKRVLKLLRIPSETRFFKTVPFYNFEELEAELLLNVKKSLSFRNGRLVMCSLCGLLFPWSPKHWILRARFSPEWKLYTYTRSKNNLVKLHQLIKKVQNGKLKNTYSKQLDLALNGKYIKQYLVSQSSS